MIIKQLLQLRTITANCMPIMKPFYRKSESNKLSWISILDFIVAHDGHKQLPNLLPNVFFFSVSPAISLLKSYGHCTSTLRLCTDMRKRSSPVKSVRRSSTPWLMSVSTWLVSGDLFLSVLFALQYHHNAS